MPAQFYLSETIYTAFIVICKVFPVSSFLKYYIHHSSAGASHVTISGTQHFVQHQFPIS